MKLPTLYKKSSTGALLQWDIAVNGSTILVTHGQVGGSLQETHDTVSEGKNLGKANATTAEMQAAFEATSKWDRQIARKGYVEDAERAKKGERDAEGGIAVMLAPSKLNEKHLRFPLDMQPKYDGVRCVVVVDDGEVTLWSRRREQMSCLPHIEAAYREAYKGTKGLFIFDGEAYRHGWALQKISTFVRRKNETRPGFEEIGHFVYDMPSVEGPWDERRIMLDTALNFVSTGLQGVTHPINRVETVTVNNLTEAWAYHDKCVAEGYEGAMARNLDGEYDFDRRSPNLLKFKTFEDSEFKIVGVKEGRGKFVGVAVFECVTEDGSRFDCSAPGTLQDRAEYFDHPENVIGQMLTVKHKGRTADKLPWHPVGKALRNKGD